MSGAPFEVAARVSPRGGAPTAPTQGARQTAIPQHPQPYTLTVTHDDPATLATILDVAQKLGARVTTDNATREAIA